MYTCKRFRISKCVLTIVLIALALTIWGVMEFTGNALAKKPDGGGGRKEEATYTLVYADNLTNDLFDLSDLEGTAQAETTISMRYVESDLSGLPAVPALGCTHNTPDGFGSGLQVRRPKNNRTKVLFKYYFTDTETEVRYELRMFGELNSPPDNWPPAQGTPAIVEGLGDWEMLATKGKDKRIACTGEWDPENEDTWVLWTLEITRN
jgi:hypothetical protein